MRCSIELLRKDALKKKHLITTTSSGNVNGNQQLPSYHWAHSTFNHHPDSSSSNNNNHTEQQHHANHNGNNSVNSNDDSGRPLMNNHHHMSSSMILFHPENVLREFNCHSMLANCHSLLQTTTINEPVSSSSRPSSPTVALPSTPILSSSSSSSLLLSPTHSTTSSNTTAANMNSSSSSSNSSNSTQMMVISPQKIPLLQKYYSKMICMNASQNGRFIVIGLKNNNLLVWEPCLANGSLSMLKSPDHLQLNHVVNNNNSNNNTSHKNKSHQSSSNRYANRTNTTTSATNNNNNNNNKLMTNAGDVRVNTPLPLHSNSSNSSNSGGGSVTASHNTSINMSGGSPPNSSLFLSLNPQSSSPPLSSSPLSSSTMSSTYMQQLQSNKRHSSTFVIPPLSLHNIQQQQQQQQLQTPPMAPYSPIAYSHFASATTTATSSSSSRYGRHQGSAATTTTSSSGVGSSMRKRILSGLGISNSNKNQRKRLLKHVSISDDGRNVVIITVDGQVWMWDRYIHDPYEYLNNSTNTTQTQFDASGMLSAESSNEEHATDARQSSNYSTQKSNNLLPGANQKVSSTELIGEWTILPSHSIPERKTDLEEQSFTVHFSNNPIHGRVCNISSAAVVSLNVNNEAFNDIHQSDGSTSMPMTHRASDVGMTHRASDVGMTYRGDFDRESVDWPITLTPRATTPRATPRTSTHQTNNPPSSSRRNSSSNMVTIQTPRSRSYSYASTGVPSNPSMNAPSQSKTPRTNGLMINIPKLSLPDASNSATPRKRSISTPLALPNVPERQSDNKTVFDHHGTDSFTAKFKKYIPDYAVARGEVRRCLVVTNSRVFLSKRRWKMCSNIQPTSPIIHPDFPVQDYSPFIIDVHKAFTIVSGDVGYYDGSKIKIAKHRGLSQCILKWDSEGTMMAILANNVYQSYDTSLYFYAPSQNMSHGVHYGQKSFIELLDNRSSRSTTDIMSYCVQDISWSCNSQFVHLIDSKGNLSLISRLGEFVWLQEGKSKPRYFIRKAKETNLSTSYRLSSHPDLPIVSVCDGSSISFFRLPQADMVSVVKSFAQASYSNELGPYDMTIQAPQTMMHIWRMVISHPLLPYVHHTSANFLNVIIDKVCESICTRDGSLSMIHSFLRFLEGSLLWSLRCQHNVSFVIPYLIRAGASVFEELTNRKAYFDFIIQMLKLIETYCQTAVNQSKRNLYLSFDAPPQLNTQVILRDCWIQLGTVFIEILNSRVKSSQNSQPHPIKRPDYAEYLSDEEADFSHHSAILTDLSTRDSKLPITSYLDLILERIKKDYAVSSIITSETLSKKSNKFFNTLSTKQKSRVVYGNLYYMLESYEKSLLQYEELNTANDSATDILFCTHILQYKVSSALNVVQKQFEVGYDILRSKIEDIPLKVGSILKSGANRPVLYAMATILILHYQQQKVNILPPIFAQSNQAFTIHEKNKVLQLVSPRVINVEQNMEELDCYYRPLSQSKLTTSIRGVLNDMTGKAVVVRLLLALGHVDEAIKFCLQFPSQRYLLSTIYSSVAGVAVDNQLSCLSISTMLPQYSVQMVEDAYSSVIRKALRDKSSEVHRILNTAQQFLADSSNLRIEVVREYLERAQDSYRCSAPTLFKKSSVRYSSPFMERLHSFILSKPKSKAENRRVQLYEADKFASILTVYSMGFSSLESKLTEGDNSLLDQSFAPLYDSMQVFCTAPGLSIKELFSEYKRSINTNHSTSPRLMAYLYEFRHFCRYMWYAYLKDSIESGINIINPFKSVYRPQTVTDESHSDSPKESVLMNLAELCGFLLDFTEIHSKVFLQGSLITVLTLLSSSATIHSFVSRYISDEGDVALTLKKRYLQLEKRMARDFPDHLQQETIRMEPLLDMSHFMLPSDFMHPNGEIYGSADMTWKCESYSDYWQFLDPVINLLASEEVVRHFRKHQSNTTADFSQSPASEKSKELDTYRLLRSRSQIISASSPLSDSLKNSSGGAFTNDLFTQKQALILGTRKFTNTSPAITSDLNDEREKQSIFNANESFIVDVLSSPESRSPPAKSMSPPNALNDRVHIPKLDIRNISDDGNMFAETISSHVSPSSGSINLSSNSSILAQKFNPRTPSRSTRANSVLQAMRSIQRTSEQDGQDQLDSVRRRRESSVSTPLRHGVPKLNMTMLPRNSPTLGSNSNSSRDGKSSGSSDRSARTFVLDL